jgi:hypothetical protein
MMTMQQADFIGMAISITIALVLLVCVALARR